MKPFLPLKKKFAQDQQGAVAVMVAVALIALFGIVALSIDVGYMYVARNELQNIADGSALAATNRLGQFYKTMTYDEQQAYVCDTSIDSDNDGVDDQTQIIALAKEVGLKNQAANQNISILDADIIIGQWTPSTSTFTPTFNQPDAVRIITRRDSTANSPITTFFAKIIGTDTLSVTATATAALTGQGTAAPGELELPVGISAFFYENPEYCGDTIAFAPTNDPASCAGWNTFDISPASMNNLTRIINEEEGYENGEVITGESEMEFTGAVGSAFDELLELFRRKGYDIDCTSTVPGESNPITDNDGNIVLGHCDPNNPDTPWCAGTCLLYDPDGVQLDYADGTHRNRHEWLTTVVVYDSQDCENPNQAIKIVGFSEVLMYDVRESPENTIKAIVMCNYVDSSGDSRGGGGDYGTKGNISGLVQ
ncbi:MAG: pilus assembly protein TadG-related protein [Thermodesulfobacteriota bacterium]|nr:pilus assembly protein TadG-related protein [Thermodesulfobacteriota bacterium]